MLQSKHSSRGAIEEFIVFSKSTLEDTAAIGAPPGTRFLSRYSNKLQTGKRGGISSQNNKEITSATIESESNVIRHEEITEKIQDNLKVADVSVENIQRKASLRKRLGESVPDYAFVTKNKSLDECDLAVLTSKLERLKSETDNTDEAETKTTVNPTVENDQHLKGQEASSFQCNVVDVHSSELPTSNVHTSAQETISASNDPDTRHDYSPSPPNKTNRARSFPPYNQNEPVEDSSFRQDQPQPFPPKSNLHSSWSTNPQFHLSEPAYRNERDGCPPERRTMAEDLNQFSFQNQSQNHRYPMSQPENYPYPNRESQYEMRNYDSNFRSQTLGRRQLSSTAVRKSEAFKRRTKSVEAVDGYRGKSSVLNSTIEEEPERLVLAKSSSLSIDCVDSKDQNLELNNERRNFSQSIPAFHDNYRLSPGSSSMSWMNTRSLANIDEDSRYEEANFSNLDRSNKLNSRSYGSFLDRESINIEPRSSSLGPNTRNSSNSYGNIVDGMKYDSRQHPVSMYNQDLEPWMMIESASVEAPSATLSRRSTAPVHDVNYVQRYDGNIYEHIYSRVDSGSHPKRQSSSSLKELGGQRSSENIECSNLAKSQNVIVSRYTPAPNLDRNDRQYADPRYKYEAGHATLSNYSGCHFSSNPVNVSRTQAYVGSSPKRMHPGSHLPYHQRNYPPPLPPLPHNSGNFRSHYVEHPPQFMYASGVRSQNPAYIYSKPNVLNTSQQFLPRQPFGYQTNPHPIEPYPFPPAHRRPTPLQEAYQKRAAAFESNRNSSHVSQPPEQLPASILVRKDGAGVTSEIFPDTSRLWRRGDVKFASDPHVRMGDQQFRNNRSSSSKSGRKVTLVL